jgi:Ca-activated chloride channel family protein
VSSSTHAIDALEEGERWEIELAELEADTTRDFVLDYALGGEALETGVLVAPDGDGQGGHFLALIEPPERVEPALVPRRDYVFIVDTSGSMSGWPLRVAQELVGRIVDGLGPDDRVNLLCFSGGSERLAARSLPATRANKARAKAFLARQQGQGGTELLQALEAALQTPAEPGLARTFVLVTDGFVSVEARAIDLLSERAGEASVFAMGIGDGVNRHLIEAVAHAGRGEPYLAMDEAQAAEVAERFGEDVAAPVLTDIRLTFEGFEAYDVEPAAIPTLYRSRPVLVSGRYRGRPEGALLVSGRTGAGAWRSTVALGGADTHPAVPLLWARERIARLSDFAGASEAPDHEAAITALGLTYSLVTRHTSFVAVDDGRETAGAGVEEPSLISRLAGSGSGVGGGAGGMGFAGQGTGGGGVGIGYGRIDTGGGLGVKGKKRLKQIVLSVRSWPDGKVAPPGVRAYFRQRVAALRRCLELAAAAPQVLTWEVAVDASGLVTRVRLVNGRLSLRPQRCVAAELSRNRLPAAGPGALRIELRRAHK